MELNAVTFNKSWEDSDDVVVNNPVKKYLEDIVKVVVQKYSEAFPWGKVDVKISPWERFVMKIAQILWF